MDLLGGGGGGSSNPTKKTTKPDKNEDEGLPSSKSSPPKSFSSTNQKDELLASPSSPYRPSFSGSNDTKEQPIAADSPTLSNSSTLASTINNNTSNNTPTQPLRRRNWTVSAASASNPVGMNPKSMNWDFLASLSNEEDENKSKGASKKKDDQTPEVTGTRYSSCSFNPREVLAVIRICSYLSL